MVCSSTLAKWLVRVHRMLGCLTSHSFRLTLHHKDSEWTWRPFMVANLWILCFTLSPASTPHHHPTTKMTDQWLVPLLQCRLTGIRQLRGTSPLLKMILLLEIYCSSTRLWLFLTSNSTTSRPSWQVISDMRSILLLRCSKNDSTLFQDLWSYPFTKEGFPVGSLKHSNQTRISPRGRLSKSW